MTAPMTDLDPKQVGREAAARAARNTKTNYFTNGALERDILEGREDEKIARDYIAGATEMLARLSAIPSPDAIRREEQERCAKVGRAVVNACRGEEEADLRQIREWVESAILGKLDYLPPAIVEAIRTLAAPAREG